MTKEYLIGQLEKKISDFEYYSSSEDKKKWDAINEASDILIKLRKETLNDEEKKIITKSISFIEKLRKFLK